ncbi:glycosyltransferase [Spiribacter vilamensis]|uniref:Glycosyltransferase involved in cell wall biosynthesis n=1 Tax=Spiribacter vilamensis TaxID=531306 RepID=A0A4Q8D2I3_9GAMM|nr:glycosyltransferase [Spiribacter vilamensis]RZU99606.1 glycosyltransferase involved in cell wall biosynthesis [Spiribacter vilamensis]TVO61432.1 glycosyltransferase family 4 protein [Spiribacter vilamensis]
MKVALLAGGSSIHTIRWANGLDEAGVEVHLITQHPLLEPVGASVHVHEFPARGVPGYCTMVPGVRRLLREIQPDLVNAHYASGYGTTARLVGYRPWLLSVWGSDVYDFPDKTPLHRWLVRQNLRAADAVASTSHCMAERTRFLARDLGEIAITPFGVDREAFLSVSPRKGDESGEGQEVIVGTVKSMAPKYGIDTLLRAFAAVRERLQSEGSALADRLRLRLVGDGPQAEELQVLAKGLGIAAATTFVGRVPHGEVPQELEKLDVYVALSRMESFGVAIIEAGAAGLPVVVSDAGGLPEVTLEGKTGFVVPREDPGAAAEAILRLVQYPELRTRMGAAAQTHVNQNYSWPACIETMQGVYKATIEGYER